MLEKMTKFLVFGFLEPEEKNFANSEAIVSDIILYKPNFRYVHIYLASIHRFPYKFLCHQTSFRIEIYIGIDELQPNNTYKN